MCMVLYHNIFFLNQAGYYVLQNYIAEDDLELLILLVSTFWVLGIPAMFGNPPLQFSSIIISIQSVYLLKDRDDAVYSEAFHVVAVSVSIKERPLKQW